MLRFLALISMFAFLVSCLPQNASTTRLAQNSTDDTTTDTSPPTFDEIAFWSTGTVDYPSAITINSNISTSLYLRGSEVHSFLSNDSYFYKSTNQVQPYCLVIAFSSIGANSQLRVKALPFSNVDPKTGIKERLFRLDFDATAANTEAICTGTAKSVTDAGAAFKADDLCVNCSLKINSTNIYLFRSDSGIHESFEIPSSTVNLTGLTLKLDPQSSSSDNGTTCTDSQCKADDKDCCLDGQCVTDGAMKPNAALDPEYDAAVAAVALDPQNKKKYKNIYFICPNEPDDVDNNPNDTGTPDHDTILQKKLDAADCIAGYDDSDYSKCTGSPTYTSPGTIADYKYVKKTVLEVCGCKHDQNTFPPYNANPYCKDWTYEKIYDTDGTTATAVKCTIIEDDSTNSPTFEPQLNINLSGRSVPHRFFESASGLPLNLSDFTNLDPTAVVQEGDAFTYQDELNQTDPQNGKFNMNSILGQITVDLKNSYPAKTISVDPQQPYVVSVTNGSYTPCEDCQTDQWATKYYPHPSNILFGNGLQAKGFETSRRGSDQFTGDTGNYEDTIFGRACWVPPTMIPFSHRAISGGGNVNTQRLMRLKTQATYFVNGYQRDWFGFNKGAVIGSFDGVSWFAVGESRRIVATSDKLFLAINSPFGDLAESTDLTVSVVRDNSNTDAAELDYDPALGIDDIEQNRGASCQRFHMCETDTDCVTKLGWEYRCADVSKLRSAWPTFNINAEEQENSEIAKASFLSPGKILHGFPDGSRKRCVYRGAGSLCKGDYTELDSSLKNLFTCAPNFYCSSLSNDDFNVEIARMPGELDLILYGQEADILGRPLNYVVRDGSDGIDAEVADNIRHNAEIFSSNSGDWGLCRPGKRISNDPLEQHKFSDVKRRTDYISQISSCDSSAVGTGRVNTCPVFVEDENDSNYGNYTTSSTDFSAHAQQNMCGKESQNSSGISAFIDIEGLTLDSLTYLDEPTLTQDACLRRAGSVCHTDLDCSPNELHGENAQRRGITYFGNTKAELNFWKESLVCGQAQEPPITRPTDDSSLQKYNNFDMTKNRCCREVGKTITIYTQASQEMLGLSDSTLASLDVTKFPSDDPKATGRYSRFTAIGTFESAPTDPDTPYYSVPKIDTPTAAPNGIKPNSFQWKSIHDTARRTCCGSGWVRKFSDGSHVWPSYSRLNFKPADFQCINYENELALVEKSDLADYNLTSSMLAQQDMLCENPSIDGCIESEIRSADLFEIKMPVPITAGVTGTLDTTPKDHDGTIYQEPSKYAPYMPRAYRNRVALTNSGNNYFKQPTTPGGRTGVSFILPMYIGGRSNIRDVRIQFVFADADGNRIIDPANLHSLSDEETCSIVNNPVQDIASLPAPVLGPGPDFEPTPKGRYCIDTTTSPGYVIFHAVAFESKFNNALWSQAGIQIDFNVANTSNYLYASGTDNTRNGSMAGNAMYYLTKLARLELLGIPQIFYDPIYCSSDSNKLVDGIFKSSIQTRDDFYKNSFYFTTPGGKSLAQIYDQKSSGIAGGSDPLNPAEEAVLQTKIDKSRVFSSTEFACCLELGESTKDPKNCCSGYGVEEEENSGDYICKLPTGTDLNVYFNRFVSGEGIDVDDELKLVDTDFIPETGEPRLDSKVYDKIVALGKKYCATGAIRKGGAFGYYNAGNSSSFNSYGIEDDSCAYRQFQILDNYKDNEGTESCSGSSGTLDENSRNGYNAFVRGYRWNHHYYCAPEST